MPLVLYESSDRIAVIRINRPAKRNAMNTQIVRELQGAWERFEAGAEWIPSRPSSQKYCRRDRVKLQASFGTGRKPSTRARTPWKTRLLSRKNASRASKVSEAGIESQKLNRGNNNATYPADLHALHRRRLGRRGEEIRRQDRLDEYGES